MQNATEPHTMADEVVDLLVEHESILEDEAIRRQVEKLKQWLAEMRHKEQASPRASERIASLTDLRDRLKLAVEERQRLESEGGVPENKEQSQSTEAMLETIRHIEALLNQEVQQS